MLRSGSADDAVVTARVRSKLGRYTSHPHAIRVEAQNGHVTLSGQVLAEEAGDLLKAICSVAGVQHVENQLEVYRRSDNIPALQGGSQAGGKQMSFLQENWNPATRAVGQIVGVALMGNCLARRSLTSTLLGAVGLGLFVRGTANRSLMQLVGMQGTPQAVRFQRTVTIHAPVEKVWDFLTDFEQVGRFLPIVRSVQALGDDHYRWSLLLPGGQPLEIEERITEKVPEERLSWESVSSHPVSYCGSLSLQRDADDTTRVNIRFDYTPPGGALGAALASLVGMDAKSQFQEAVMRIKPFLETGVVPHDVQSISSGSETERSDDPHSQSQQDQMQQGQSGQPEWVQGQPGRIEQLGQEHPGMSMQIQPDQIPPVHVQGQSQSDPNHPERGRLG